MKNHNTKYDKRDNFHLKFVIFMSDCGNIHSAQQLEFLYRSTHIIPYRTVLNFLKT